VSKDYFIVDSGGPVSYVHVVDGVRKFSYLGLVNLTALEAFAADRGFPVSWWNERKLSYGSQRSDMGRSGVVDGGQAKGADYLARVLA
jgi:hypothetical protein